MTGRMPTAADSQPIPSRPPITRSEAQERKAGLYEYLGDDLPHDNDDLDGREREDLREDGLPVNASPFHGPSCYVRLLDTAAVDSPH